MRVHNVLAIVLAALSLGACSSYTYNAKSYSTSDKALAAQAANTAEIKESIATVPQGISGKAIVITPSKATCEALGITRTGSPPKEFTDYISMSLERGFSSFAEYLETSRAFSSTESMVVDFPQIEARKLSANYAATIYLQMKSPTQVGWYMLTPEWQEAKQINIDLLAANGAPKINSWIQSIVSNMAVAK